MHEPGLMGGDVDRSRAFSFLFLPCVNVFCAASVALKLLPAVGGRPSGLYCVAASAYLGRGPVLALLLSPPRSLSRERNDFGDTLETLDGVGECSARVSAPRCVVVDDVGRGERGE